MTYEQLLHETLFRFGRLSIFTLVQNRMKSFFCVLRKMQKQVIVCIYYCVSSKTTIDERLNGFIAYNVLLRFNKICQFDALTYAIGKLERNSQKRRYIIVVLESQKRIFPLLSRSHFCVSAKNTKCHKCCLGRNKSVISLCDNILGQQLLDQKGGAQKFLFWGFFVRFVTTA